MSFADTKINFVLVEDDELIKKMALSVLQDHTVTHFTTVADLHAAPKVSGADILILDLCHPKDPSGESSIAAIPELARRYRGCDIFVCSGLDDIDVMRRCVRAGAARFILKDQLSSEMPLLAARHLEMREARKRLDATIFGQSLVMQNLKRDLLSLRFEAGVDVLVEGETGTGKELCAQALHAGGPLVAVNVSAVSNELFESEFFGHDKGSFTGAQKDRAGYLEEAGAGTLFLDEVQNLAPQHQSKLLRVLETRSFTRVGSSLERPFRGRIVSASNRSLRELVAQQKFREDLYYRLSPISVQVPPLRLRDRDAALLAQNFLQDLDQQKRFRLSQEAQDFICSGYDWPGNVRELKGLMRSMVLKATIPVWGKDEVQNALNTQTQPEFVVKATGVNFQIDWSQSFDDNVGNLERFMLSQTLSQYKGTEAREKLQIARSRFYEKVKQYGLLK
jgi:DNA-binding NtrC family response regulator